MNQELDLFDYAARSQPAEADIGTQLHDYLMRSGEWRTRRDICKDLSWSDRQVRDAAEQLGSAVIRGQLGFKLVQFLTRDDFPTAVQAADAFMSQGKQMIRYSLSLRRRLHAIIQ